jgi:hypothetical protein
MEDVLLSIRLVGDAEVVVEAADDAHLVGFEPRLHPEGASGSALAGEAVADRDGERLARDLETKLPTVTGGFADRHRDPKLSNLTYRHAPMSGFVFAVVFWAYPFFGLLAERRERFGRRV